MPCPLSVIMTVYNSAKHVKESMESILSQTFRDFELIIVCDPSTDNSLQILNSFNDTRIRVITPDRRMGRVASLNMALNAAQGQLVAVQDADDISRADRFDRQMRYMEQHSEVALLGTWWEEITEEGDHLRFYEAPADHAGLVRISMFEDPFAHSSVMYRRDLVKGLGGYPLDFPHGEDFALWLKVMRQYRVAILPSVLVKIRLHESQLTQSNKVKSIIAEEEWRLLQLAISHPQVTGRLRMNGLAMADLKRAYIHSLQNQKVSALKWLARFLVRYPNVWLVSPRCWKYIGGTLVGKTARDFAIKIKRRATRPRDHAEETVH